MSKIRDRPIDTVQLPHLCAAARMTWSWPVVSHMTLPLRLGWFQAWLPSMRRGESVAQACRAAASGSSPPLQQSQVLTLLHAVLSLAPEQSIGT